MSEHLIYHHLRMGGCLKNQIEAVYCNTREAPTALPVPKLTKIKQNDMNSFMCTQIPTKCMNKQQLMTNVSEKLTIFNIYFSTKQRLGRGKWQIQLTLVPLLSSGKTPFMTNLRLSLA